MIPQDEGPEIPVGAHKRPFWWFGRETLTPLYAQLHEALSTTGDVRLEVHQQGPSLTLHVITTPKPAAGEMAVPVHAQPLNDSHICPPDCPGNGG